MPQTTPQRRSAARLTTVVLAAVFLSAACGAGTAEPGAASPGSTTASGTLTSSLPTSATATPSTSAAPSTSARTATPSASSSPTTTKPPGILRPGAKGPEVVALQRRLNALGYWAGPPDGQYGNQTSQAVMAVQKAAGLTRDAVLGPRTRAAVASGVRPTARTESGSAIEVDLKRQLVLVVQDGQLRMILNTSTGSGRKYTSDGVEYVANTPAGKYRIQRQIDGLRVSRLGKLWRPKYFFQGYALHGAPSVPGYPASHGCVRLSNAAIDMLWTSGVAPIGQTVWIY